MNKMKLKKVLPYAFGAMTAVATLFASCGKEDGPLNPLPPVLDDPCKTEQAAYNTLSAQYQTERSYLLNERLPEFFTFHELVKVSYDDKLPRDSVYSFAETARSAKQSDFLTADQQKISAELEARANAALKMEAARDSAFAVLSECKIANR